MSMFEINMNEKEPNGNEHCTWNSRMTNIFTQRAMNNWWARIHAFTAPQLALTLGWRRSRWDRPSSRPSAASWPRRGWRSAGPEWSAPPARRLLPDTETRTDWRCRVGRSFEKFRRESGLRRSQTPLREEIQFALPLHCSNLLGCVFHPAIHHIIIVRQMFCSVQVINSHGLHVIHCSTPQNSHFPPMPAPVALCATAGSWPQAFPCARTSALPIRMRWCLSEIFPNPLDCTWLPLWIQTVTWQ